LTNAIKKRCTAFVLSDFMDKKFDEAIQIANNKHDVIAIRIYDARETVLPDIGLTKFKDAETGQNIWVDTSNPATRKIYENWFNENENYLKKVFIKSGVDVAKVRTDEDYVKPLVNLFKRREARL
jgi:uncharacterized protein (DUF58 family)